MTPTREQLASIDKLVKQLCDFVPEGGWQMPGIRGAHKDAIYYEKGDEDAPLDSESCTYNLCGKGSGRTLLGILDELKTAVAACLAAPPPPQVITDCVVVPDMRAGEVDVRPMDEGERAAFWQRYEALPSALSLIGKGR